MSIAHGRAELVSRLTRGTPVRGVAAFGRAPMSQGSREKGARDCVAESPAYLLAVCMYVCVYVCMYVSMYVTMQCMYCM